jgi:hypothetical protein
MTAFGLGLAGCGAKKAQTPSGTIPVSIDKKPPPLIKFE